MKKILLSCVTCLLALGLVTACDDEVEDVTPEDPNAGVVEGGGEEDETGGGTEITYKLGVLNENLYSYYYFDGTLDGRFASGTDEWDKGVSLTVTTSEEGSTLSWEEEGVTYYLGYGVNESSQNIVTISTEVSYLIINEEHDSIEDPSGKYFLGTYNEFTTFSWCGVSYYDEVFVAHLYTSAQTNPTKPGSGDEEDTTTPFFEASELEDGESYYLGFPYTSSGETSWYMFDGTTDYYGDYLQCSVLGAEDAKDFVELTVIFNDDETFGLTWTDANGTEYTVYAWPNSSTKDDNTTQYGEITFIATSSLESAKSGAVTAFSWNEEHCGFTVTLSNGEWYAEAYQGKSAVSLTGIDSSYSWAHFYTANPNYAEPEPEPVPEVVEPDLENDNTYKLGVLDTTNAMYRYFDGSTHTASSKNYLTTTTTWADGANVYITAQPNYTEENSCTLSIVVNDELQYIAFDNSDTPVSLSTKPCVVVFDSTDGVFATGHDINTSGADRMLCLYSSQSDIRAYKNGNYDLVTAYSTEPSLPAVESITVSGATTVEVGSTITLVATIEPKGASTEVTWSSSSEKATVDANGVVTGVTATELEEVVTITAKSTYTTGISGSIEITVTEAEEEPVNYVGTIDFSDYCTTNANTNAFGANGGKDLQECLTASYTGEGTITAGNTENASPASNGSNNSGLKDSKECIQLGSKDKVGYIEFSLKGGQQNDIEITTVVVKALAYDSGKTFTVNDVTGSPANSESYSTWDQVEEIEFTITAASTIKVSSVTASGGRILVHSIKLYTAVEA